MPDIRMKLIRSAKKKEKKIAKSTLSGPLFFISAYINLYKSSHSAGNGSRFFSFSFRKGKKETNYREEKKCVCERARAAEAHVRVRYTVEAF